MYVYININSKDTNNKYRINGRTEEYIQQPLAEEEEGTRKANITTATICRWWWWLGLCVELCVGHGWVGLLGKMQLLYLCTQTGYETPTHKRTHTNTGTTRQHSPIPSQLTSQVIAPRDRQINARVRAQIHTHTKRLYGTCGFLMAQHSLR